MAWFAVDLDNTLVDEQGNPIDGAIEAMNELTAGGHRLSVFTARFAPMPETKKYEMKQQIEEELAGLGFPEMEVWTGSTKPSADIFIGDNNVTFDGDWGLAIAQAETMLQERGITNIPPDDGTMPEEPQEPQEPTQPMPEGIQ